jgi:signal transduction histidine kinase
MDSWLETFARANFLRSADTAHDLKTPLNVAVLNLELLRMRLRKLGNGDDEKIANYAAAIETELRRMGRIFDSFFLMATPPKDEAPQAIDVAPIVADAASSFGVSVVPDGTAIVEGHEARIRQACKLFFEGASKLLAGGTGDCSVSRDADTYTISMTGRGATADLELSRIFKLYYTDAEGNPDLSLAVARLIAETYGGDLNAVEDRDKVSLRLSFPLGAQ